MDVGSGEIERPRNTAPFAELDFGLARLWSRRTEQGRRDEPFNSEDKLALRNVIVPFLEKYTDGSPIIPWLKERLNPHNPNTVPCHRLELDNIAGEHNWRDKADVAAIPMRHHCHIYKSSGKIVRAE
jgi:hypothetical protein